MGVVRLLCIGLALIVIIKAAELGIRNFGTIALILGVIAIVALAMYIVNNPLILPGNRRSLVDRAVKFVDTLGLEDPSDIKHMLREAASNCSWLPRDIPGFIADVERTLIGAIALTKIQPHLATLRRKKAQNVYSDDYGLTQDAGWVRECDYFARGVLLPLDYVLPDFFARYARRYDLLNDPANTKTIEFWVKMLDDFVEAEDAGARAFLNGTMTGHEYEKFVGDIIKDCGWDVLVTKGSGDQGADVIAQQAGVRVVMQCKLYSSPVGNKAVQEVYAAKTFYDCDYACVVSNAGYTPSARKIAERTDVQLLHHDQIPHYLDNL